MYIQNNNARIYYEIRGNQNSGRPPIVLLHGNGEDMSIFDRVIEPLLSRYEFILIDTRGHGKSEILTEDIQLSYDIFADDVMAVVRELGINQMHIVGFSDGAVTGLLLASNQSSSMYVQKLIAVGANINPKGLKSGILNKIEFDRKIAVMRKRPLEAALNNLMLTEPNITDEQLGKIFADTTIVAGSHDVVRKEHTKHIASAIMHARLKIIDGADHLIPQKLPGELGKIICEEIN